MKKNIKNIQVISLGAKLDNEDRAYSTRHSAWVLDGATGLGKNIVSNSSDASWYSQEWNDYLINNVDNFEMTLTEIMQKGLEIIQKKYAYYARGKEVKSLDAPSSGIALFRQNETKLEYFILGDCMMLVKEAQGIKKFIMPELRVLDNISIAVMKKVKEEQSEYTNILDARKSPEVEDILAVNRLKKNKPNGYWVLSLEKDAINNALRGDLVLDDAEIMIMSDGFYSIVEDYKEYSFEELFKNASEKGLRIIAEKIREIECNDANCNRYPRFKKGDDCSAVYVRIENK